MPVYVYEIISESGEGEVFEIEQRMSDKPLTHHPETGEPVRQIITPVGLVLKHGDRKDANIMSDSSLNKTGLSRYEKTADGTYTRTAGKTGPETFKT